MRRNGRQHKSDSHSPARPNPPRFTLGIDVGSSKIAARLLELRDDRPPIVREEAIERPIQRPAESYLIQQLGLIITEVLESGFAPDGIGIAVPGQVNLPTGTLTLAPNLHVHLVAVKNEIQRVLTQVRKEAEVRIDNDARCAARCELHLGVGRQYDNFVCIFFGHGVGSGIVLDRKIRFGQHFCAGEFGHHKLDLNGGPCNCGARGCFETFVNATAIVRRAEVLAGRDPERTTLREDITTYTIAEAAAKGDLVAKEVLNEIGGLIGAGIANYINILDPGVVVLGGGVVHGLFRFMSDAIHKAVNDNVLTTLKSTTIVTSEHVDDAPAIGAALLFSPSEVWPFAASQRPVSTPSRVRPQP
jgi:predicted NBD/HSP70 family sugar kinase